MLDPLLAGCASSRGVAAGLSRGWPPDPSLPEGVTYYCYWQPLAFKVWCGVAPWVVGQSWLPVRCRPYVYCIYIYDIWLPWSRDQESKE